MSPSHDHMAETSAAGYGGGGRTARPLLFLIPIGIALVIVLALLAEGVNVMTSPTDNAAGEAHIVQTAVPSSGAGASAGG